MLIAVRPRQALPRGTIIKIMKRLGGSTSSRLNGTVKVAGSIHCTGPDIPNAALRRLAATFSAHEIKKKPHAAHYF